MAKVRPEVDQAILDSFWNLSETSNTDRMNSVKVIMDIIGNEEVRAAKHS